MRGRHAGWLALVGVVGALSSVQARAPERRYEVRDGGSTDTIDDSVLDVRTQLVWQRTSDDRSRTRSDAASYCAALRLHDGAPYRLPSRRELASLVDYTTNNPAIDSRAFPATPLDSFWTSTPYAGGASQGWYVDFTQGNVGHDASSAAHRVRCVHSAP